jgi:ribosomal protein S18 acetylase RimI-like enzyme
VGVEAIGASNIDPGPGPLHGQSPDSIRLLALHEAHAHAHGNRQVVDLGDAILLHDPDEPDPFLNRLSAVNLPEDPAAFDRRLAELIAIFAELGRRPHVWLGPAFHAPPDIAQRLMGEGFVDLGGTNLMIQLRRPRPPRIRTPNVTVRRLTDDAPDSSGLIENAAMVMAEAFGVDQDSMAEIARELEGGATPESDVCLLSVGGEPVSAGRRYTAGGATYLSSIGTRPHWIGLGFGTAVTAQLAEDGRRVGGTSTYLAVEWSNQRAQAMYHRLGFETVGGRAADLLLA